MTDKTPDVTGMKPHPLGWIPNALTVGRILALPLLIWLISGKSVATPEGVTLVKWALGLFVLCGITDFLDGFLARKWNVQSDFGRMLDPIADKLLVAGSLIAINLSAATSHGILWVALIPSLVIIARDILVSGVREHAALSRIVMVPTRLAKWKTAFEMLAIFLFLLAMARMSGNAPTNNGTGSPPVLAMAAGAVLWLAAILSAWTGWLYFRTALRK